VQSVKCKKNLWKLQRCRFVEYWGRELDYFRHTNYARSRILDDVTVCGNVTAVADQLNSTYFSRSTPFFTWQILFFFAKQNFARARPQIS
jgi:hypothetical protein